jgi:2'-5' RNA ligase
VPTIGVSIAVPEPWGSELQQYRIGVGDQSASRIPTHITLVPPYDVADTEIDPVVLHLERVARRTPAFTTHLRGTGTFRPVSPVVFVNVVEGISHLEQLAADVREGPLSVDATFPYHPHVTIAHDLPEAGLEQAFVELERYDASFEVDRMWLYVHSSKTGWQPARSFPLEG